MDQQTGEFIPVEVFVAVLGGSQCIYAEATLTQQQDDFINSLNNCLAFFKGVPQAIVTDNLKQAVTKSHKYEPNINKQLRAFSIHYNTSILPTRAYKPQDKSPVERAVSLVYQRVFYHLKDQVFFNLADLNKAITKLLQQKLNSVNFQHRPYSRYMLYLEQEKKHLQPLPESKYQIRYFRKATVQKNYHIYFGPDKHYYSVPYKYVGNEVTIQYNKTVIEIYYDHKRIAMHLRSNRLGDYTTVNDHMPANHRYVKGWSMEYFTGWAKSKDQRVYYFIEKLFEKATHPEHAYKSCMGIQSLQRQYGLQRLSKACQRAMEYDIYKYKVLENILKKGVDQQPEIDFDDNLSQLPEHKNIRGQQYYA